MRDAPNLPPPHVLDALRRPRWLQDLLLLTPAERDALWQRANANLRPKAGAKPMPHATNSNIPPIHLLEALRLPRDVQRLQIARMSAVTLRDALELLAAEAEARGVAMLTVDPLTVHAVALWHP